MRDETETLINDTIALGLRNQDVVQLATAHCLNFEWRPVGGLGMVEQQTGLPIGMRLPHCAYAKSLGGVAGADLLPVALAFYEENCVGCGSQRPTGRLPNLGTVAAEQASERDVARRAAEEAAELARQAWWARAERRKAILAANAHATTQSVVVDLGILDPDPATAPDDAVMVSSLDRLRAIAERAPEQITRDAVDHMVDLVVGGYCPRLLAVLRPLAVARREFADSVLEVAISILSRRPDPDAGRCLVDLALPGSAVALASSSIQSVMRLAVEPERGGPAAVFRTVLGAAADPSPLRTATDLNADLVEATIRDALRVPPSASGLILPVTERAPERAATAGDHERVAAATAVEVLSVSHPAVVLGLVTALLANLKVPDQDRYGVHARSQVARAAAVVLVRQLGDVIGGLERIGAAAGKDEREALFQVVEHAADLIDPSPRWPRPHDPQLGETSREDLVAQIVGVCLRLTDGRWGEDTTHSAAKVIEDLCRDVPHVMVGQLSAVLGAFLSIVARIDDRVGPSPLAVPGTPAMDPTMHALETFSTRHARAVAANRLLDAAEHLAANAPLDVVHAVGDIVADQRDQDRDAEATWRLLGLLGKLGAHYGDEPRVLNTILPILHTYLVDTDVALRAGAIDAWATIARRHRVPDSLSALLPALTSDPYVMVIKSVLKAARWMDWDENDRNRLIVHAAIAADARTTPEPDVLKSALATLRKLTSTNDAKTRATVQLRILDLANSLTSYDLVEVLRGDWEPEVRTSVAMARLWLRLARDPQINDRFNASDDDELVALLECSAGLRELTVDELRDAAVELLPNLPHAAAEFAEVCWCAGRNGDAEDIFRACCDATPDQPVYSQQRRMLAMWAATAHLDASADSPESVSSLTAAARETLIEADDDGYSAGQVRQVSARGVIHAVLSGHDPAELVTLADLGFAANPSTGDPAARKRLAADQLDAARVVIASHSQARTPTAAYLRAALTLCDVAGQVLRAQGASLDADITAREAHYEAAAARARIFAAEARQSLPGADLDLVAGPLLLHLDAAGAGLSGRNADEWLAAARFPLPLLFVRGPRSWSARRSAIPSDAAGSDDESGEAAPVAVALASVDGRLITDTQVMTPHRVHTLGVEVRLDRWPEWADHLEGVFVSHLAIPDEAEIPALRWNRPTDPGQPLTADGTLIIRFSVPSGGRAPQLLLALRFVGTVDGQTVTELCQIAGHTSLRLRPFDSSRDVDTGWPSVDERLLELYERLHAAGYNEDHIQAYCRLLTATCRAGFRMSYEGAYRAGTKVTERAFHDDLEARLRADPELGGRIERGARAALGFLDLRHDKVTLELKVEPRTPVTEERIPKYLGQPTQYAGSDGVRVSLLAVLDMSRKTGPIGTPENYIWHVQPQLHGLTNPEAPSFVTAVVINGSLPTPSSWSRRKVAIVGDAPSPEGSGEDLGGTA